MTTWFNTICRVNGVWFENMPFTSDFLRQNHTVIREGKMYLLRLQAYPGWDIYLKSLVSRPPTFENRDEP